jgi:hypothetical protein
MTDVVITPPGLLAFPTFYTAKPRFAGGDPAYSGILVFSPEQQKTDAFKELKEACVRVAKADFGSAYNPNALKWPFRKGEEKPNYAGFDPGTIFISAWTKNKPGVIDASHVEINDPAAVWAGQMARFSLTPFTYNTSGNKGVSLGLRGVLISRQDMPRIDGRGSAKNDFAKIAAEEVSGGDSDELPF